MAESTTAYLKSGVAGGVVLLPALFAYIILIIAVLVAPASVVNPVTGTTQLWYVVVSAIANVILGMGALLISLGTFGLWKLYKNMFPVVVGIIGIVVTAFCYMAAPVFVFNQAIGIIVSNVATILAGIFFILLGIAFILLRGKTGASELSLATSILSLIAGVLALAGGAVLFAGIVHVIIIGFVLLIPTAICVALIFFKLLH